MSSFGSHRGFRFWSSPTRLRPVAGLLSVVLAVTLLEAASGPAQGAPLSAAAAAPAAVVEPESFERSDVVSARLAAAALDREILITGETTDMSLTYARPDGTLRSVVAPVPVRVRQRDGSWRDVDYDLMPLPGGGYAPKVSPVDVVFSGGGTGPAVTLDKGSRGVDLSWASTLPAPTIAGPTARYALGGGQTLVLSATSDGFEQSLELAAPPATAPRMRLGFDPTGLDLVANDQGGFDFVKTDPAGAATSTVVFTMPAPVMYSAQVEDEAHTQVARIPVTLGSDVDGSPVLDLSAGMGFLTDPATVYPVTIDPTVASVSRWGDTYVTEANTVSHSTDPQLFIGLDTANKKRRSLIRFNAASTLPAGSHVTSATLSLWNNDSGSCTASAVNAFPITAAWAITTVTWATQPAYNSTATYKGTGSFAYGNETLGCPNNTGTVNVTNLVQGWVSGAYVDNGLILIAGSETATSSRKTFCSMNTDTTGATSCTTASRYPTLSVTYNTYPKVPTGTTWAPHIIGTDSAGMSTSVTPTLTGTATNADGAPYKLEVEVSHNPSYPAEGTGVMWTGTSANTTAGAMAAVTAPAGTFSAGQHVTYRMRAKVTNGSGGTDYSGWSATGHFFFNINPPAVPTIGCATYVTGAWTAQAPGAVTCTIDTTSTDGSGYLWSLDDPTPVTEVLDTTNTGAAKSISITPSTGWHTLYALAKDTARHASAVTSIQFGVGVGGNLTPREGDVTAKGVALSASAPSGYTQVTYQWAPGTSTTWADVPPGNVTPAGSSTPIGGWPQSGTTTGATTSFTGLNWDVAATGAAAAPPISSGVVQVRACFAAPTLTLVCGTGRSFSLAQQIFAGAAPTADLGPATVSLLTGDAQISEDDVTVGGLSLGRTATTLTPAAATTGPTGIFGAGWAASLPGVDAGAAEATLVDNSSVGSMTIRSSEGSEVVYAKVATNTFVGTGESDDGSVLTYSTTITNPANTADTATYTGWQLTDLDGTVTTWLKNTTTNQWLTAWVDEAGKEGETTYSRDAATGRVTTIIAPTPAGITCTPASFTNPGCSVLQLTYAASSTAAGTAEATWGDWAGLLSKVRWTGYDPATSAMATKDVAQYLYDNTGRLRAAWDPRLATALKTRYTYDGNGRISTVTDPGRAAWTLTYDTSGRLASVSRPDPANGTATQAIAYGLAVSGVAGAPDVSGPTASTWGQATDWAYTGAAVFPASHVPAGPNASGVYTPTAADWPYADLTYADVNGRTVNTAGYGAGGWQIDSTRYDGNGNQTWSLDDGNRAQALTPTPSTDPYVASQTTSAVRADLLAEITTYTADGVDPITTLGPTHPATLSDGSVGSVRVQATNTYDQGAPTTDPYHLVTTTVTTPVALDGTVVPAADAKTTVTGYTPIDGAPATGDTSGWTLKAPTTVTTWMGTTANATTDLTTQTRYDSAGRAVETRLPGGTATSPNTTKTTYYTSAANTTYPACGGKPWYAAMVCRVDPGGAPSAGYPLPVKEVTAYTLYGQPATVTETSGTVVRTTTSSYDPAGRPTTTSLTVTGLASSTAVTDTTLGYDPNTGDLLTTTQGASVIASTYDTLGRQLTYKDADTPTGATGTYSYDIDGNIKTLNDGQALTTYTYDSGTEHRGLLTSLDTGMGAGISTFTGSYDAAGQLTSQTYPNGMTAATSYDNTGDPRTLTYTLPTYTGGPTANTLTFTTTADPDGSTVHAQSPLSAQDYTYDNAGRLTQTRDTANGGCTTRGYTFDKQGDRTGLTSYNPATDGSCQTTTPATTLTSTYDTANRITNTGYTYDQLGRTLTVPQADLASGGSALTVAYYHTDMPVSMTQTIAGATTTKNFTLDPAGRYRQVTDTTTSTETRRIRNRYTDNGDSPAIIETSTNAGATWTWDRNILGIDSTLAAIQPSTGTPTLQITNLHGDIVATLPDHAPSAADPSGASTTSYFENTEYGTPRDTTITNRYTWLGGHRRSTDSLANITLMGVRLYNPATGRFLSVDPIRGGNENAYSYPNDPVNEFDLDGRVNWRKWGRRAFAVASVVSCFVNPVICGVLAAAGAAYSVARRIRSWRAGTMSGRRAFWGSVMDIGLSRFRYVKAIRTVRPKYWGMARHLRAGVRPSRLYKWTNARGRNAYRYTWRRHRSRMVARHSAHLWTLYGAR
jgi:RHS repeat-associated protein